jgi:hypothetical protein
MQGVGLESPTPNRDTQAMRSTAITTSVRLYHLSDSQEGGAASTLFYGSLDEAMRIAAQQPEDVQDGLFLATDNDVVAYLDLLEG